MRYPPARTGVPRAAIMRAGGDRDKPLRGRFTTFFAGSAPERQHAKSPPAEAGGPVEAADRCQSICGSMIAAKAVRARLSRDFTVPRLQSVISAISSYDFPSSSRRTNTWR